MNFIGSGTRRLAVAGLALLAMAGAAFPSLATGKLTSVLRGTEDQKAEAFSDAVLASADDREWTLSIEGCRMTLRPSLSGVDATTRAFLQTYRDSFSRSLDPDSLLLFAILQPVAKQVDGDARTPRCDSSKLYTLMIIQSPDLPKDLFGVAVAQFNPAGIKTDDVEAIDFRAFNYFFGTEGLAPMTKAQAEAFGPVTQAIFEATNR